MIKWDDTRMGIMSRTEGALNIYLLNEYFFPGLLPVPHVGLSALVFFPNNSLFFAAKVTFLQYN